MSYYSIYTARMAELTGAPYDAADGFQRVNPIERCPDNASPTLRALWDLKQRVKDDVRIHHTVDYACWRLERAEEIADKVLEEYAHLRGEADDAWDEEEEARWEWVQERG